eukprot:scaffold7110_cov182-Alexandrium_tamarense.AAC.2
MGQYASGPELGLCMNEVFGDDIDVLVWDFASLQPSLEPIRRTVLWGNRAGMHPTHPILFSFDSFGNRFLKLRELDGAVKCDDPMRNFLCYVDAEMMDGDNVGSTKICRENKLITKPEWYVL